MPAPVIHYALSTTPICLFAAIFYHNFSRSAKLNIQTWQAVAKQCYNPHMNTSCYNHPDSFALTTCAACGRPLCARCIRQDGRRALCSDDFAGGSSETQVMIEPYRGPIGDTTSAIGLADEPTIMPELKDAPEQHYLTVPPVQGIIGRGTFGRTSVQGGGAGDALAILSRIPVGIAAFVLIYNLFLPFGGGTGASMAHQMQAPLVIALFGLLIVGIYLLAGKRDPRRVDRTDAIIVAGVDLTIILICLIVMALS